MRAKFIASSNLGMDETMPKDVYGNIYFGDTVTWSLDRVRCFSTSMIEQFEWHKKSKRLKVFTLNSVYEFELEEDTFHSNFIQCAKKEIIEHYRLRNETTLYEAFIVRILTLDDTYEEAYYKVEAPISFYDVKTLLVGQEYNRFGIVGKIMHVYPPMQNGWV